MKPDAQRKFALLLAMALGVLPTPAAAKETEFDRLIRLWREVDPEPTWVHPPNEARDMGAAMNRDCTGALARLEATLPKARLAPGRKTPEYIAAFKAHQDCRRNAALQWRDQNDPSYRVWKAWHMRDSARHQKAWIGELAPPPQAAPSRAIAPPPPSGAASGRTAVPPLRPTKIVEAHNPAGEAGDCVTVIYQDSFEAQRVSSTQKAVFRNSCPRPIEVTWCTISSDCRPGYSNIFTVLARSDRGFSYEPATPGSGVNYAACYNGFVAHQGELSKTLLHACK